MIRSTMCYSVTVIELQLQLGKTKHSSYIGAIECRKFTTYTKSLTITHARCRAPMHARTHARVYMYVCVCVCVSWLGRLALKISIVLIDWHF